MTRTLFLIAALVASFGTQAATMYSLDYTATVDSSTQTSSEAGTGAGILSGNIMEYSMVNTFTVTESAFGSGVGKIWGEGEFDLVNLVLTWSLTSCEMVSGAVSLCDVLGIPNGPHVGDTGYVSSATSGPLIGVEFHYSIPDFNNDAYWTFSAVPVPAAAWLFGSALFGLTVIKRKKS